MKYRLVIFISALLSMLMMTVFSSCEKEEDESEKDESYEIQVAVENYRNEVVYLYIDDNFMYMISAGKNWNWLYKTSDGNPVTFEVRKNNGQVLDSKIVGKGNSYYVVINPENSNQNSDGSETSDTRDVWTFPIEIVNNSSTPIRVFVNGREAKIITEGYRWTATHSVVNQSSVTIQVETSEGKVLDSKTVSRGGNYVKTFNDPTFTITKITLTKWNSGNWLDKPDPWFEVLVNGTSVGRTNYLSDRTDGEVCTWSNLNIQINKIYSKVTLDLYDYNIGYSSIGSSYIGGVVSGDFSTYWGKTSFEWSTTEMAFTIYGTWN